jgi:hypothetical protein
MWNPEHVKLSTPLIAPRDFLETGPHLRWELQQVMARVRPDDLSAVEISKLLAILIPAHSRVINGPAGQPAQRILEGSGEQPAPKFAPE